MKIVSDVQNVPGPHYLSALVRRALGDEAVAVTAPELPVVTGGSRKTTNSKERIADKFCKDFVALMSDVPGLPGAISAGRLITPVFPSVPIVVAVILQANALPELDQRMVNAALDAAEGQLFANRSQIRTLLVHTGVCEAEAQTIVAAAPFRDGGE